MDQDYLCGDYGEIKEWIKIKVTANLRDLDLLSSLMTMVSPNLEIEDYSDIAEHTCYGELIDEKILNADKTICSVSVYVPKDSHVNDTLSYLKSLLDNAKLQVINIDLNGISEEDWANEWKQYYKPFTVGKHIQIVPAWEEYQQKDGDIVIKMDPGLAFGTGSHETTKLILELLEDTVKQNDTVLDVGCGSGILAICASKLGAKECLCCDIDPMCVKVVGENAEKNQVSNITYFESNLLDKVPKKPYNIICANLVADIILRMLPNISDYMNDNTLLLLSGIINLREEEIKNALSTYHLKLVNEVHENDWCALSVQKA